MKKLIVIIMLIICELNIYSQNFSYDITFIKLEIEVNPSYKYIKGKMTAYFKPLTENFNKISFDFSKSMTIDSVIYKNKIQNYTSDKDVTTINLQKNIIKNTVDSISIYYQGEPPSIAGFGTFITSTHKTSPIMWTLSEPYGAKTWFPCKQTVNDKADSLYFSAKVPIGNRVAGNGLLTKVDTIDNQFTVWHWKHLYPIVPYLIAFATTNYEEYYDYVKVNDTITVPILNYVYPESFYNLSKKSPDVIDVFQFYCDTFMMYPFWKEKYGHAQFGWGGGMEHQTMSFMKNFDHDLMAHELAHQWFGNYITCASWQDIWLNEGFAVYLEGLTAEMGLADYSWNNWKSNNIYYVTSLPSGSVFCDDTTSVNRLFDYRLTYIKGGMILHLLRWQIGDKAFFDAIRNYLNDPKLAYGFAKVEDLKQHFENTCNCDLTYFFEDWYYGQGYPSYQITWNQSSEKQLNITINQKQSHKSVDFFELNMPIKIKGLNNDTLIVLNNNKSPQTFIFDVDFEIDNIIFDPEKWIITRNPIITKITTKEDFFKVKIFPNPIDNEMNIKFSDEVYVEKLQIYDTLGNEIKTLSINLTCKNYTVNTIDLKSGTYIINIYTNNYNISKKFIKK